MPFNRGFRNGDNNRMQSSSFSSAYQPSNQRLSNISPWEGGVVPNSRPSNSQGLLALPSNQLQQNTAGLLSAQQQLALASSLSLLSSLGMNVLPNQQQQQQQQRLSQQLQFQQPQQRQDNLPSLLRMGRSPIGMMGNSQPSFGQQGQNNYRYNNHPSDRFRTMDAMKNKLHQNMNSNRTEPYNMKNRAQQSSLQQQQARRPFVTKPKNDRKPPAGPNKQGIAALPGATDQRQKFRKPDKLTELSESAPKEQEVESKTVEKTVEEVQIIPSDGDGDEAKRDEEEGSVKRDWKDEKKDDIITQLEDPLPVAAENETEANAVNKVELESNESEDKGIQGEASKFHCHICNVNMGDEKLLGEHLLLESHKTLMEKTSESYQAQAAALRLNMQEVHGKRNNRQGQHREYCKMCKLNFSGTIANHRRMKEHLQLKTFLHPRCLVCSKEFPTRIEWDVHKLTASHQILELQLKLNRAKVAATKTSSPDKNNGMERKGYQPQRIYGFRFIAEGFFCRVCEKFFEKRADSRKHAQTEDHYNICVAQEEKEKEKSCQTGATSTELEADPVLKDKQETLESNSSLAESAADTMEMDPKDETDAKEDLDDQGGDCKRRKLMEDDNDGGKDNETSMEDKGAEPFDISGQEESTILATENELLDGEEDEPSVSGFLLDDDINLILEESGLDLGIDKSVCDEQDEKSSPKARRGGRAARGRKRK